jgi:hypothetical protein
MIWREVKTISVLEGSANIAHKVVKMHEESEKGRSPIWFKFSLVKIFFKNEIFSRDTRLKACTAVLRESYIVKFF